MSGWTTTVPNSVRKIAPVGHTSRQAACVQCLQTSDDISQRKLSSSRWKFVTWPLSGTRCSMHATCSHVSALSPWELSCDQPVQFNPSSGTPFHSLHATSQALQPMHTDVSVKKPMR